MKTCKLLLLALCCGCVSIRSRRPAPRPPRIVNIVNFIRNIEPRSEEITENGTLRNRRTAGGTARRIRAPGHVPAAIRRADQSPLPATADTGRLSRHRGGRLVGDHAAPREAAGLSGAAATRGTGMPTWASQQGTHPKNAANWWTSTWKNSKRYSANTRRPSGHGSSTPIRSGTCTTNTASSLRATAKNQIGTDGYSCGAATGTRLIIPAGSMPTCLLRPARDRSPSPYSACWAATRSTSTTTAWAEPCRGVISLEPVYGDSGGSRQWVEWFFRSMFEEPCLAFAYTQAGQENSFTWGSMEKGLNIQIPLLANRFQGRNPCGDAHPVGRMVPGEFPGNAPDGRYGTDRLP